jgi:hypothetical protein
MTINQKLPGIPEPFRDMVDHSPTLQGQLKTLIDQGWKVEASQPGDVGVSRQTKTIRVSTYMPINLAEAATLALQPYGQPTLSFDKDPAGFQKQFDETEKLNWAAAALDVHVVRAEVLKRGGKDPQPPPNFPGGPDGTMAQEERDMNARLDAIVADPSLDKDKKVRAVANLFAKRVGAQDIQPEASISIKTHEAGRDTEETFVVRHDGTEEFNSTGSHEHAAGVFDHAPDAKEKARTSHAIDKLRGLPEPAAEDKMFGRGQPAVTIHYKDAQGQEHQMTVNMDYVTRNRDKLGDFSKVAENVADKLDPPAKTGGFGTSLGRVAGQR